MSLPPDGLTLTQAAERAGVTAASLRQAIGRGSLKAMRVGEKTWVVRPADLDEYMDRGNRSARLAAGAQRGWESRREPPA